MGFLIDFAEALQKEAQKSVGKLMWLYIGLGVLFGAIISGLILLVIYIIK